MATASLSSSNAPEHVQKHIRLVSASVSGNENRVLELLTEETWSTHADHHALRQALVKIATKGNLKVLRLLLEHGAGVHPKKDNELSPLFKAAEAGHLAVVAELLEHGADPNWRGKNGQTALFPTCMRGHNGVVKTLLDKGADVNGGRNQDGKPGDKDGRTPLLFLASEKRGKWTLDTIKLLLQQRDVNLDPRDSISRTPLHWTATNNYIDLARIILSGEFGRQADVNASQNRGKTALHLAAEHNQVDFVELLLAYGANPDAVSDGRWTPLHNACDKGHDVVVAKLLAAGANVNAELSNRMTPLHWAAFKSVIFRVSCQCYGVSLGNTQPRRQSLKGLVRFLLFSLESMCITTGKSLTFSHIVGMEMSSSSSWKDLRQISLSKTSSSGRLYFARQSDTTKTWFIFSRLPGLPTGYLKAPEKPPSYSLQQSWTLGISRR